MAKKESKDKAGDETETIPNPADMTVPEIKELVESGELSGEQLAQLKEAEAEEKGRASALDVIEKAMEESEAGSSADDSGTADTQAGSGPALSDGSDAATGADAIASGRLHLERGNHAQAQIYFERAQMLFEKGKDEKGITSCIEEMAIVALLRGEQEVARTRYQEALDRYRQQGNKEAQVDVLQQLGLLHRMRGDTTQMRAAYEEARSLSEDNAGAGS